MVIGALALMGERRAAGAASAAWILYPTSAMPVGMWVMIAWVVLGLLGTGVQLGVSDRRR